jgi:cytochrome c oxidase subunit IV
MTEMSGKQAKWLHWTLVLLMFACTGLTVARLGAWIMQQMAWERFSWQYWLMWIGLLPIYNLILLAFGFVFGKSKYVRDKQRRYWRWISGIWRKKD